jgi:hypothetical protein
MLFSVFGTPSALTYAGCTIVRAIADSVAGSHAFLQAVFLEDLKKSWAAVDRAKTPAIVLFSDFPATALIELIRASRAPIVVFLDDFAEVVHHSVETRDMSVAHALRFASQAVCALDQLKDQHALLVTPKSCRRPIEDLVYAVCDLFGLGEPETIAKRVITRLGYKDDRPSLHDYCARNKPRRASDLATALRNDPHVQRLIAQVADQYAGVGTGDGRSEVVWPAELFLNWDNPGTFLNGPIDLLGPARFVICGPYLHLIAGDWIVQVVIEVTDNLSGNRLGVDVFSGGILKAVTMTLPSAGLFEFSLLFRVADPFLPVELRFQIMTGAIEGKLILRDVRFRHETA